MKKKYIAPQLISEEFEPQAFCAVCYFIACEMGLNEDQDGDEVTGDHTSFGCKNKNKNAISIAPNGNVNVYEKQNIIGWKGGNVEFLSDPTNDKSIITYRPEDLKNGMTLHWVTRGTIGGSKWECIHSGTLNLLDSNRSNLS